MKKYLLFICSVLLLKISVAQPYGNEWIDYSKVHYKIKVTTDGMYRIPYATLNAALPNLGSVNPANFALFHNGQAVPIYVSASSTFGNSDFIEFYGKKNIGDVDSVLYPVPGFQPHTYYSLSTDTSIYYLTVNNLTNNARLTFVNNDTASIPSLTKDLFFWQKTFVTYTTNFFQGKPYVLGTDYLYKCIYDEGESYGSAWINSTSALFNISLPTVSLYTAGPTTATLRTCLLSRSDEDHNVVLSFNGTTVANPQHSGFRMFRLDQPVSLSSVAASNTLSVKENGPGISTQQNLISYAELIYPRKFEFGGQSTFFFNLDGSAVKRYFEVNNFNANATQPLLYDLTNGYIIRSTDAAATFPKKFVLPASSNQRELFIRADVASAFTTVNTMDSVSFQDYTATAAQGDYIIITHNKLNRDTAGTNYVEEYRQYRDKVANPGVGKYDARVFDIDQIYEQFGYGIRKSPLAIRNFVSYSIDKWSAKKPEHLFIIGKGREYHRMRAASTTAQAYPQCLVPPFGFPGSDNLLTATRENPNPRLAVGRLAAQNVAQVRDYLEKVKTYELQQNTFGDPHQNKAEKDWMKQVLHFAGGETVSEQFTFQSYLQTYQQIVEDSLYGAHVTNFYKTSAAPIQTTQAQIIKAAIDTGVSVITFFGHAAATAFDISIDEPENYTNKDKYPMILSNGCFTGFIHDVLPGYSERFVFAPNKGAIGFVATSSLSVSSGLHDFSTLLYENFAKHKYYQTFGKAMQQTAQDVYTYNPGNDFDFMVANEMTLHGDPALKLNQYNIPDYEIDNNSVYFTPSTIDASYDSFDVNIIVTNLGRAPYDSFAITVKRSYQDGNNTLTNYYIKRFKATLYKDTFTFKLPTLVSNNLGFGQNNFEVLVDANFDITELSETNNGQLTNFSTFIASDDVIPIYPYEFAIVPKQNPILKSSTVNPFAPLRTYRIQIDTTENYAFPLAQTTITQIGGVLHWQVPFTMKDSTVYYWRVSRDSVSPSSGYNWHYTSFLYLKDEYPGWNQSHYFQYQRMKYPDFCYLDSADRIFKYNKNVQGIHVTTGWSNATGGTLPASDLRWDLNSSNQHRYRMGGCGFLNGVTFGVVDPVTGQPWASVYTGTNFAKFGNYHCIGKNLDQYGFDFLICGNHPTLGIPWAKVINNFLDSIPNGAIIVMYTDNKPDWTCADTSLVNRLAAMGAVSLPSYKQNNKQAPYTFLCEKGNPAIHDEAVGVDYATTLNKDYSYSGRWNQGTYYSPKIGPAFEWGSVHWRFRSLENPSSDRQNIDVVGIDKNNIETTLWASSTLDTTLNFVNAAQYPYIRLRMHTQDDTTKTPQQLYYWRVLYKKAPEAAINPAAYFKLFTDTVGLGDSLNVQIALENVTDISMDSMRTKYTVRNVGNGSSQSVVLKQDSLRSLDTMILNYKQPLTGAGFAGLNQFTIEANPEDNLHQLEQFHFNNFAIINFNATGDKINPLLDVTFDGQHILNGDIVSAKPNILVMLKDENKHLALNDTSLIKVYLQSPGQSLPQLIPFDNNILTFYPATGNIAKNNTAHTEFKPTLTQDGVYHLFVKDKDRSDNESSGSETKFTPKGYYNYDIQFEVINKPMITNVLNYPNPFSTSTQFIFTLTGSELPQYMKIQIMTITGKVVKEITKEEIGPVRIGLNRTEYKWNGRDEYGDALANGVYFYRVITNLDGKQMDHLSTTGTYSRLFNNSDFDKYFKKGFGKLVIMR